MPRNYAGMWVLVGLGALVGCTNSGGGMQTPDAGVAPDTGPSVVQCARDEDCDDTLFCNGQELCRPAAAAANARGCIAAQRPACETGATCDEAGRTCVSDCATMSDQDEDGHRAPSCGGDDCDDHDRNRYPGNVEVCDAAGHDEDCDNRTNGGRDADRDGVVDVACCNPGDAPGTMRCGEDCDDAQRSVHPGATEACDRLDNDCDGMTDEGVQVEVFADADHDGHGEGAPMMACAGLAGVATIGDDCDDHDGTKHPGQLEVCDGLDNDCDGMPDDTPTAVTWYRDLDGDGFGATASGILVSCVPPVGYSLYGTDCDDTARGVSPAASERCDGRDNDCNGIADYAIAIGDYEDDDHDGHVDVHCAGFGDDPDDRDALTYPGAPEVCDGKDNDGDGRGDDLSAMLSWYLDGDGDGYGASTSPAVTACVPPPGRVLRAGDCDDTDVSISPAEIEVCNDRDDDCDMQIDDGAGKLPYWPASADADGDGFAAGAAVFGCTVPAGALMVGGDCDDVHENVNPGRPERCDGPGVDTNCNGVIDEALGTLSCGVGACRASMPSCVAGVPQTCMPGAMIPEACDGIDNDCNGVTDDVGPAACGGGTPTNALNVCLPSGCTLVCRSGFRNCDANPSNGCETSVATIGGERCDGRDNDCDGAVDEDPNCPTSDHALSICSAGSCVPTALCEPGWGDCNAAPGCETDLTSSAANCGFCGNDCSMRGGCGAGGRCLGDPVKIVAGAAHTCVLRGDGSAYCWGRNTNGQIGNGSAMAISPLGNRVMVTAAEPLVGAFDITALANTTCVLRRVTPPGGGVGPVVLSCAGDNTAGQLGTESAAPSSRLLVDAHYAFVGTDPPMDLTGHGGEFACVRLQSGSLVCQGANDVAQFGNGAPGGSFWLATPAARPPIGGDTWERVVCGPATCVGAARSGNPLAWGNYPEMLGLGGTGAIPMPLPAAAFRPMETRNVSIGRRHTCQIHIGMPDEVRCAGANDRGQLGRMVVSPSSIDFTPVILPSPPRLLAVGGDHTCTALDDGSVYCWGRNDYGQAGGIPTPNRPNPMLIPGLPPPMAGRAPLDLALGDDHSCVLYNDGAVYCWGRNNEGQLGNGMTIDSYNAVLVTPPP